ncbi:MAG: extracellular solute-binding protein [Clostridia bacterium]|nr:extracellular solute-binding protein [Clostridia bacterium]
MKHFSFPMRVAAGLLAVLLLALTACSGGGEGSETTAAPQTQQPDETTAAVDDGPKLDQYGREIIEADLPDVRFDGETFTIHTRGNVEQYEWKAEEVNGEPLNDAIYKRNRVIEDKYGVTIQVVAEGSWSNYSAETLPRLQASIQAQTGEYDLIAGYSSPFSNMVTTGMLYDLNTVKYIDFDKPWWWSNFTEATEIDGVNYFGLGELSLSAIYSMTCVYFNPAIMDEANNGVDPYQLVLDGKWTWDKMAELGANAIKELDGDNQMGTGDRWGVLWGNNSNDTHQYVISSGEMLSKRDGDGMPVVDINSDRMTTVIDRLLQLFYNTDGALFDGSADVKKMFIDGKGLFLNGWMYHAQTQIAAAMEAYGVLPTPKMEESQEDYHTWIQVGMHMYSIPVDVRNLERAAILTEALAAETYATLLPAYYEIILKARYFSDEASSQMLDIIYDSVSFDFVRIFDGQLGMQSSIWDSIKAKQNTFSSSFAAFKRVYDKKMTTLLDKVAANAG